MKAIELILLGGIYTIGTAVLKFGFQKTPDAFFFSIGILIAGIISVVFEVMTPEVESEEE